MASSMARALPTAVMPYSMTARPNRAPSSPRGDTMPLLAGSRRVRCRLDLGRPDPEPQRLSAGHHASSRTNPCSGRPVEGVLTRVRNKDFFRSDLVRTYVRAQSLRRKAKISSTVRTAVRETDPQLALEILGAINRSRTVGQATGNARRPSSAAAGRSHPSLACSTIRHSQIPRRRPRKEEAAFIVAAGIERGVAANPEAPSAMAPGRSRPLSSYANIRCRDQARLVPFRRS